MNREAEPKFFGFWEGMPDYLREYALKRNKELRVIYVADWLEELARGPAQESRPGVKSAALHLSAKIRERLKS